MLSYCLILSSATPTAYDEEDYYYNDYSSERKAAEAKEMKEILSAPTPLVCDQQNCVCEDTLHLLKEVYICDSVSSLSHIFNCV